MRTSHKHTSDEWGVQKLFLQWYEMTVHTQCPIQQLIFFQPCFQLAFEQLILHHTPPITIPNLFPNLYIARQYPLPPYHQPLLPLNPSPYHSQTGRMVEHLLRKWPSKRARIGLWYLVEWGRLTHSLITPSPPLPLNSSPYHSQMGWLVECMLKKCAKEEGKNWAKVLG